MTTLSIVIPCYNESRTLSDCVDAVRLIADDALNLEIVIVDDASTDDSAAIAASIASADPRVTVCRHPINRGKGAALRTGFEHCTGETVAVQDADLEYDPNDLKRLVVPIIDGRADVVFGSRYLTTNAHRVLHFWHTMGNRALTTFSNMMTDMNLTDMETCYKLFRREIIQSIHLCETRFGFEPEVVAKIADRRLSVYEMGISYDGRTYADGKKIGIRDGIRALYCIVRYNGHRTSLPIQLALYLIVGVVAALVNLALFLSLYRGGASVAFAAGIAFGVAAAVNYLLCVKTIFRRNSRFSTPWELAAFAVVVIVVAVVDVGATVGLIRAGVSAPMAKCVATIVAAVLNFLGRRHLVFRTVPRGPWRARPKEQR